MKMIRVISSHIKEIGYDYKDKDLYIRFWNNQMYVFYGAPLRDFHGMIAADSKGQYFHEYIRDFFFYDTVYY